MKKIITGIFMLAMLHSRAQVNEDMPDISDIVHMFFVRYTAAYSQKFYLQFEKRKNGWYVSEVGYPPSTVTKPARLFWDKPTHSIQPLQFDVRDPHDTSGIKEETDTYVNTVSLDESTTYNYRRNLYFGYRGWDWDVITDLKGKPSLSDTLYESLARAYSSYAINYFYNQTGYPFVNNDSDRLPIKDNEPVSESRVEKYMFYENLAIAAYQKLIKLNRDYQTMVGDAGTKKQNEKMFAFTTLRFLGFDKQAVGYLDGITFPDSIMAITKNMLEEVKPNSILITYGDNTTYPVWLLQAQGVRNDVISVDYSLLGLRRVLFYLDKKYKHTLFGTDSTVYNNPRFDYSSYESAASNDTAVTLGKFLESLYSSPRLTSVTKDNKTTDYTGDSSFKFFTKDIYVPVNTAMARKMYGEKRFLEKIKVPVKNYYLFINDVIGFSVIEKNFLRKRIYFTYPVYDTVDGTGIVAHKYVWELTPEIQ